MGQGKVSHSWMGKVRRQLSNFCIGWWHPKFDFGIEYKGFWKGETCAVLSTPESWPVVLTAKSYKKID
jgi:hypothetical protein